MPTRVISSTTSSQPTGGATRNSDSRRSVAELHEDPGPRSPSPTTRLRRRRTRPRASKRGCHLVRSAISTAGGVMSGTGTETPPRTELPVAATRPRGFAVSLPDAVIVVVLAAVAFIVRRHVPADGLFYDDAWQALGASKGSFAELITLGQTQPGFTASLMVWSRLFGTSTTSLVTPALIAGTLGPPALYLGLHWLGAARSIAFLAAAALSTQVSITYSYHVKTYTFDVLIVLGLALAVHQLARQHWRTSTAVGWFVGSSGVLVVAYKASSTLAQVLDRIPADIRNRLSDVLVCDDHSDDATYLVGLGYGQVRSDLPLTVVRNSRNLEYGGIKNLDTSGRSATDSTSGVHRVCF